MLPKFLAVCCCWLLCGCSPLQIVDTLTPSYSYQLTREQAYGELPRQQLDIYRPSNGEAQAAPVVVFFYGGRWQFGAKEEYRFVAEALAARGFVVVVPDYRLYPQVRYPTFLQDCAAAVTWASRHIGEFGGDPAQIHLMGHSAGAYNAMMLGLNPQYLQQAGNTAPIRSVIGMAGPYDFLPLTDPALQQIFGPESAWPATQPIGYVTPAAPPVLLQLGGDDDTVKPGNSERLAERLRQQQTPVELLRYGGLGHAGLIGALALPFRLGAPVLDDIEHFLRQQTKGAAVTLGTQASSTLAPQP